MSGLLVGLGVSSIDRVPISPPIYPAAPKSIFEVTTGSLADAAEVRCSYQLGKGRPKLAKLSAYKAIFLAFSASTVATILFLSLGGLIPGWMTTDPTIQAMLAELFPLMALGNITMNTGWVCWSLIGAQGRYHIGTFYQVSCSLFITIPLSAMFTFWWVLLP